MNQSTELGIKAMHNTSIDSRTELVIHQLNIIRNDLRDSIQKTKDQSYVEDVIEDLKRQLSYVESKEGLESFRDDELDTAIRDWEEPELHITKTNWETLMNIIDDINDLARDINNQIDEERITFH